MVPLVATVGSAGVVGCRPAAAAARLRVAVVRGEATRVGAAQNPSLPSTVTRLCSLWLLQLVVAVGQSCRLP